MSLESREANKANRSSKSHPVQQFAFAVGNVNQGKVVEDGEEELGHIIAQGAPGPGATGGSEKDVFSK